MKKRYWGLMLTGCMFGAGALFVLVGISPNYSVLLFAMFLVSIPVALWHLPSAVALSQIFEDRRGWAILIHGLGANLDNIVGPVVATSLLGAVGSWRIVLFVYAVPSVLMGIFVWLFLRDIGNDEKRSPVR